jgi:sigma-B regulation protein RsbU (phosphoserine phosphatase)
MTQLASSLDPASIEQLREQEIEEARILQRAMLPTEPLRADPFEITSQFRPMVEVGGDFLDYFLLSDRTLGLYLGDVVGKGLPAALYAALAVGTIRGINKTGESPSQVLEVLNKRLRMRAMSRRYCAVQYAVFDPETRLLRYSSAGMPGPLHISSRGCRELRLNGLPSGMFDGARYDLNSVPLEPGDSILFITDGFTEALNKKGEDFGMDRLMEICAQNCSAPAGALLGRIFGAVDEFAGGRPQHDDMTAALLRFNRHRA